MFTQFFNMPISMILKIIFWVLLGLNAYALFATGYLLLLSVGGRFFYRKRQKEAEVNKRIAILVPAYKEDGIILSTASHFAEVSYPADFFDIYIIADALKKETIHQLQTLPVTVLEVSFDQSTKSKSLYEAFQRIEKTYDVALIIDADNILARNVLKKINDAFVNGSRAIQTRRVAKNLDTPFAILDACSEAINNHLFRKGADALGLSSSVIGSGMAFDYSVIKEVFNYIHGLGGTITHEDKILQLKVVERGFPIEYLEDAIVFDEKVDSPEVFAQQRRRWVSGQFIYLKHYFLPACRQLLKGNINYFTLAVTNNLILPRAFLLIFLGALSVASFFVKPFLGFFALTLLLVYLLTLVMALPPELRQKDTWNAIKKLPRAILIMIGTLRHSKKANQSFIHTVHTKTTVSNSLFNEKDR